MIGQIVSPQFLEMIKADIMKVISYYAEIDVKGLEVKFTKTGEHGMSGPALIANIPIIKMKDMGR